MAPHLVRRSLSPLSISMVPRKEPANSGGSVAENYSLHMPASKTASAAARWGPALYEEDSGNGRMFVYNVRLW